MKYFTHYGSHRNKKVCLALLLGCFVSNIGYIGFALAQIHRPSIEIVVKGRRFESINEYRQSKQSPPLGRGMLDSLTSLREVFLTPLFYFVSGGHNFRWRDQSSMIIKNERANKTFLGKNEALRCYEQFLPALAAMSKVGFNTGVIKMIEAFQNAGNNTIVYKNINRNDLESALSKSFPEGGYSGPILLISDKNKVRILTLDSK